MNITKEDVQWLLVQMRHNEFSHDFIKDEKRCIKCKRIEAIRARLEAVAPMLVPDAYRAGFIEACRWPEPVSQDVDSGAFASAFRDWLAATPPNTTCPPERGD